MFECKKTNKDLVAHDRTHYLVSFNIKKQQHLFVLSGESQNKSFWRVEHHWTSIRYSVSFSLPNWAEFNKIQYKIHARRQLKWQRWCEKNEFRSIILIRYKYLLNNFVFFTRVKIHIHFDETKEIEKKTKQKQKRKTKTKCATRFYWNLST